MKRHGLTGYTVCLILIVIFVLIMVSCGQSGGPSNSGWATVRDPHTGRTYECLTANQGVWCDAAP